MTKAEASEQSASSVNSVEFAKLETTVNNLAKGISEFVVETRARFTQLEAETQTHGKINWPALGVIATIIGGLALLYVRPLETDVAAIKQQISIESSNLDARLQREMRQLNDVIIAQAAGTKEMMGMRLNIDEKRLDDVTNRVDRRSDDERQELNQLRMRIYGGMPATKSQQ
jgi:hypothetical protein